MAFKSPSPSPPSSFSIFAPKSPYPRRPSEIRFSRWNNANAQKFVRRERHQKEIEDEIRRERRFQSATLIAENREPGAAEDTKFQEFKSVGTPSSPSRSSIPGKASKYSKTPPENPNFSHPAFRPAKKASRRAVEDNDLGPAIWVGDNGVSYRVPDAPFEFQYSYTETPKVRPLALREPPVVPFGPATMPRPWTGRKPLPPSKKKLPEFDSFRLPPPHKKGVKPVQSPGPFVSGSGPKYVKSREEILGEALTGEEINDLVQGCLKTRRQLNMGRDGLTHNMLDNIHNHWKRRRVCKIKCKGVCTVDMDNVRQQLEEKTGGKIIYGRGGVLFLFRGRNYNYRTRPKFPLMLWKPATPVYPRLVEQVPEGLTREEATEMRKRSQKLPPICKLGKNGVYDGLVNNVKEAFEECDLVRINCQGMNVSDYKKIGGKLKDLVPCVLISFEHEHILMWRGRDWKSSLPTAHDETKAADPDIDSSSTSLLNSCNSLILDCPETSNSGRSMSSDLDRVSETCNGNTSNEVVGHKENEGLRSENNSRVVEDPLVAPSEMNTNGSPTVDNMNRTDELMVTPGQPVEETCTRSSQNCTEGVLLLLRQAIEGGSALILDDDETLDATIIYKKAVALAKTAPPGPVFRYRIKKALVQKIKTREGKQQESANLEIEEFVALSGNNSRGKKSSRTQRKQSPKIVFPDVVPHGSLGVDELAKLLA